MINQFSFRISNFFFDDFKKKKKKKRTRNLRLLLLLSFQNFVFQISIPELMDTKTKLTNQHML
ncbi:hypothetical protein HanIR_Chr07g0331411 [Helianthus annuus]|nr:hypothetical protein HanIR_Chr07g0331411 [Helianthus annuus]